MLKLLFPVALLICLAGAAPETRKKRVFQVETRRHVSMAEKLIREGRLEELTFLHKSHGQRLEQSNSQQSLRDYKDTLYVGEIKLGTPQQNFSVLMETGSADLWVIDAVCESEYEQDCKGQPSSGYSKHRFDGSKSSTFANGTQPFLERYDGNSAAGGTVGYDVIDLADMKFDKQGFGVVRQITADLGLQQIDGVLGLGGPALSVNNLIPPLWNMLDQLEQPIFTVFMARNQKPMDTTSAMDGGRITFGGLDDEKCDSQINYVPVNSEMYWQVKMDDFAIGNWQAHRSYTEMIFDTSTSFIGGPPEAVNYILAGTGAWWDTKYQHYILPCKGRKPDMVFKIGGIDYRVPAFEYVLDYGLPDGNCVLAVSGAPQHAGQTWNIGAPFMRHFCLVHDIGKSRIGFARSVNIDNGSSSHSMIVLVASVLVSRLLS